MTRARLAAALDLVGVLLFTLAGRSSHAEALSPAGVWRTAWPFAAALAAGWLLARAVRGRWPLGVRDALPVWAVTVGGGMVLRGLTGQGTDPAFVVVAAAVLAGLLLGWRAAGALVSAIRVRRGGAQAPAGQRGRSGIPS